MMDKYRASKGYATKVELHEAGDEYLLFVPIALKERAKAIENRKWDPDRRCWTYPRTKKDFDALIGEFADEAVTIAITLPARPDDPRRPAPDAGPQQTENAVAMPTSPSEGSLASLERELAAVSSAYESEKKRADALERRLDEVAQELVRDKARGERAEGPAWLRDVVKTANAGDADFARLIDALPIDERAPIEVTKELEARLARLLGYPANAAHPSLSDLIGQARDSERISTEAYHLAQQIRFHRNVISHQKTDKRTIQARIVLVVSAAALLWPDLPE